MERFEIELLSELVTFLKKISTESETFSNSYDWGRACGTAQAGLTIAITEIESILKVV